MPPRQPLRSAAAAFVALTLAGCAASPFESSEGELRRSVVEAVRSEMQKDESIDGRTELTRLPSDLDFSPARTAELNAIAGPNAYENDPPMFGPDLLGLDARSAPLTLRDAIASAVANNLDTRAASLLPAIGDSQLIVAEAVFDWSLFADFQTARNETERAAPVVGGVPVGSSINRNTVHAFETGVRKRFASGGVLEISQALDVFNNQSPNVAQFPDPSYSASVGATLFQPLLRGFGDDVNLAEVRLAANLRARGAEDFRTNLIDTVLRTEAAYWEVAFSIRELQITRRLLDRGVETREALRGRLGFDVRSSEFSDAVAQVEARRVALIRVANQVRQRSDELKRIINDQQFPLADELIIMPVDGPMDEPISFNLFEAIAEGLSERPELRRAALAVDDARIFEDVADDGRLPILDLNLQARASNLGQDAGDAYDDLDGDFLDYLIGLQFEWPIGNRGPEAEYTRARLERLRAVVEYRSAAQGVVLDVKTALRSIQTNYALIEQTRTARLAASESLRTILAEEETIRGLTPDFLDLKLRRQEALALTEVAEIRALADYNVSLAALYAAMGVILERKGIDVVAPSAEDALSGAP